MPNQPNKLTVIKVTTDLRLAVGITVGMIAAFFVGMSFIVTLTPLSKSVEPESTKLGAATQIFEGVLDYPLPIHDYPSNQENPAVYDNTIVWQDDRNSNLDIYMYDIEIKAETRITNNTADQTSPAVFGNYIIWQDYRNGNWDIYLKEIGGSEEQITFDSTDQTQPAIDGSIIVWTDFRNSNSDIYYYDFNNPGNGVQPVVLNTNAQEQPAISGNHVVWQDYRNGNWDIYLKEIGGSEEQITDELADQILPDIQGDTIVWRDERDIDVIYKYSMSGGNEMKVTYESDSKIDQTNPVVYGDNIVWQEKYDISSASQWRLYRYNIPTSREIILSEGGYAERTSPAIYENTIVWQVYRNENWDIFVVKLPKQYLCGDVDNSGQIDISDLVYFVDYMFKGGPEPPIPEAANMDGLGGIDISDLVYLVSYQFREGPYPLCEITPYWRERSTVTDYPKCNHSSDLLKQGDNFYITCDAQGGIYKTDSDFYTILDSEQIPVQKLTSLGNTIYGVGRDTGDTNVYAINPDTLEYSAFIEDVGGSTISIVEHSDKLFIGHSNGLSVYDFDSEHLDIFTEQYSALHGTGSDDGYVYFSGGSTYYRVNPSDPANPDIVESPESGYSGGGIAVVNGKLYQTICLEYSGSNSPPLIYTHRIYSVDFNEGSYQSVDVELPGGFGFSFGTFSDGTLIFTGTGGASSDIVVYTPDLSIVKAFYTPNTIRTSETGPPDYYGDVRNILENNGIYCVTESQSPAGIYTFTINTGE